MEKPAFLKSYEKYSLKAIPSAFLSGDVDKRSVELVLHGKKSDDLNGEVKRHLIAEINRHFWLHPRDTDDTRLVYEATEKDAALEETPDGRTVLRLRIEIGLAQHRPEGCC